MIEKANVSFHSGVIMELVVRMPTVKPIVSVDKIIVDDDVNVDIVILIMVIYITILGVIDE